MVSIDNVYKTVLNILNKENRGYITPAEFNTLAKQAQTEIFEGYFSMATRASLEPAVDMEYMKSSNIEEKISIFEEYATSTATQGIRPYPDNFYRLSTVIVNGRIADEVSNKEATYINLSPLTKPTATQPIFTRTGTANHVNGGIEVLPQDDINVVQMIYLRIPNTPVWNGTTVSGQIVPIPVNMRVIDETSPFNFQDFELHPSEEPELVAKILAYSGVIVRAADVVQAASAKDQQIIASEQ